MLWLFCHLSHLSGKSIAFYDTATSFAPQKAHYLLCTNVFVVIHCSLLWLWWTDRHVLSFNYTQSDTRIVWATAQAACRCFFSLPIFCVFVRWHAAGNENTDGERSSWRLSEKQVTLGLDRKHHVSNCHIACAIKVYALKQGMNDSFALSVGWKRK